MRVDDTTVFPTPWRSRRRAIPTRLASRARSPQGGPRARSPMAIFPRRRCEQQSRQSHHQHPVLRGRSEGCVRIRFGLHRGRAFGVRVRGAGDRQALPRAWRHGHRHASEPRDHHGRPARLEQVEWAPFRAAIHAGVDAIMSAHIAVPALDAPDCPPRCRPKSSPAFCATRWEFKGHDRDRRARNGRNAQGYFRERSAGAGARSGRGRAADASERKLQSTRSWPQSKKGRITQKRVKRA